MSSKKLKSLVLKLNTVVVKSWKLRTNGDSIYSIKKKYSQEYKKIKETLKKLLTSELLNGQSYLLNRSLEHHIKEKKNYDYFRELIRKNKPKKRIVLLYDTDKFKHLYDISKYEKYIKGKEFQKLSDFQKKMFIELSNSHKNLNCKSNEKIVCSTKDMKLIKPTTIPNKPKPISLKQTKTKIKDVYQTMVGIIARTDKDKKHLKDMKIQKEFNELREVLRNNESNSKKVMSQSEYNLLTKHTLSYIIKRDKSKTFKKKISPKTKTLKKLAFR